MSEEDDTNKTIKKICVMNVEKNRKNKTNKRR